MRPIILCKYHQTCTKKNQPLMLQICVSICISKLRYECVVYVRLCIKRISLPYLSTKVYIFFLYKEPLYIMPDMSILSYPPTPLLHYFIITLSSLFSLLNLTHTHIHIIYPTATWCLPFPIPIFLLSLPPPYYIARTYIRKKK